LRSEISLSMAEAAAFIEANGFRAVSGRILRGGKMTEAGALGR